MNYLKLIIEILLATLLYKLIVKMERDEGQGQFDTPSSLFSA